MNGDGCCPPGATPATDTDCIVGPGCGNGIVDPGETCDTLILAGPGRCPTTCSDGMACTRDVLVNAGTCTAACSFPAITMPAAGDGCCPRAPTRPPTATAFRAAATAWSRPARRATTATRTTPTRAATPAPSATVAADRVPHVRSRSARPHVFVDFLGCRDVTDTPLARVLGQRADPDQHPDRRRRLRRGVPRSVDRHGVPAADPDRRRLDPGRRSTSRTCTGRRSAGTTCSRTPAVGDDDPTTATNLATGTVRHAAWPAPCGRTRPSVISPQPARATRPGRSPCRSASAASRSPCATRASPPPTSATPLATPPSTACCWASSARPTPTPRSCPRPASRWSVASRCRRSCPAAPATARPRDDRDMNGAVRGWWFYLNFTAPRVTWFDN
jgi:hypothetical protein